MLSTVLIINFSQAGTFLMITSNSLFLLVLAVAFAAEFMDSSLGMGYGTTLSPILLMLGYPPEEVIPALLFSEMCCGLVASCFHHSDGNINILKDKKLRKTAAPLFILSILGTCVAAYVTLRVSSYWLVFIIGLIITIIGLYIIINGKKKVVLSIKSLYVIGFIASFNKAFSGGGYGPLISGGQIISGISPVKAVATTSLAESLTCLVGLAIYTINFKLNSQLLVPLMIGSLSSVPLATVFIKYIPEKNFKMLIGYVTALFGIMLLSKTIFFS